MNRPIRSAPAIVSLIFVSICFSWASDQAKDALDEARRLTTQGKFGEALQKYIWFHDHALEIDQSYYGVRLSFALADWVQLGKKYPRALEALKEIRNKKTSRLLAGELDRSLFHDVVAINEELGESKVTVEAFKKIQSTEPGFASSIADVADKALFDANEYELEKKYLGDPRARFAAARRTLDFGIEYSKTRGAAGRSRQAFENNFSRDVVRLIVVLDKTGDRDVARQIQAQALAACNKAAIKNALTD